jgi:hypothetical protein
MSTNPPQVAVGIGNSLELAEEYLRNYEPGQESVVAYTDSDGDA